MYGTPCVCLETRESGDRFGLGDVGSTDDMRPPDPNPHSRTRLLFVTQVIVDQSGKFPKLHVGMYLDRTEDHLALALGCLLSLSEVSQSVSRRVAP